MSSHVLHENIVVASLQKWDQAFHIDWDFSQMTLVILNGFKLTLRLIGIMIRYLVNFKDLSVQVHEEIPQMELRNLNVI